MLKHLDHEGMRRRKLEYSGMRLSQFIVLRELHVMKGPDSHTEATFSSSEIVEKHNIIKRLWHHFRLI